MWRPARLAEQLAEQVLAAARVDARRAPIDVEEIAQQRLGLLVQRAEIAEEGRFKVSYGSPIITVRVDRPAPRQRFTIAHETGHWALSHSNLAGPQHLDAAARSEEIFCNLFAGALLLPRAALEREFGRRVRNDNEGLSLIVDIARSFRVSLQAATVRLRSGFNWRRTLLQWQHVKDAWLFEAEAGVFPWEEGLITPGEASYFLGKAREAYPQVVSGCPLPIMAPGAPDLVEAELVATAEGGAALIPSLDVLQEHQRRLQGLAA